MMASKNKDHHSLFGRKMRQFKQELRSGSFNGGFYRFWLFNTASAANPFLLN